jgi:hypothetical protein
VARGGVTVAAGCTVAVAVALVPEVGVLSAAVDVGVPPAEDELVGGGTTVACPGGVIGSGVMSGFKLPSSCDSVCERAVLSGGVEDGTRFTASTVTARAPTSAPATSTKRHSRIPTPASVSETFLRASRAAFSVRKLNRHTRNADR